MATRKPRGVGATGAATPLKLRKHAGRSRGTPSARDIRPADSSAVTLEEMLVAFQKSLARATRASFETSRSGVGFGLGEQSLYVVDALNISLNAGCVAGLGPDGKPSHILLDFERSPEQGGTARFDFRVQARPLEALAGAQIILADLDPLGLARPDYRLRGTLLLQHEAPRTRDGSGPSERVKETLRKLVPQADRSVDVHIVGGDTKKVDVVRVETNAVGQFDIAIDAERNRLSFGDRWTALENVKLATEDDDFFVFAAYEADDLPEPLVSNIMRFDVKRRVPGA